MPEQPEKKDPVVVILDCEIGRTVDNALTLALLYGLSTEAAPLAQLSAVALTRSSMQAAAYCDAVGRFYNAIHLRDYPERFQRYRGFAVGLDNTQAPQPSAALAAALDRRGAEDKPLYEHEVHEFTDTADPVALIRNALTAEKDGACAIVLAGAPNNLTALLKLNGGKELVAAKVSHLSVALDAEPVSGGMRRLITDWPTPVATVRPSTLTFPTEFTFPWSADHPVADAFRASGKPASTTGLAAALYTVRPETEGFQVEQEGKNAVVTANDERLLTAYRDILATQPAARELPDFLKRFIKRDEEDKKEEADKKES